MSKPLARIACPICDSIERMEVHLPMRMWGDEFRKSVHVSPSASYFGGAAVCPNCQTPFGLLIRLQGITVQGFFQAGTPDQTDAALRDAIIRTIPEGASVANKFPNLPALISENFIYIQEDAQRKRNPAGIMSGARSCLDVALKALGQADGGRRERINKLAEAGVITTAIAAWAQTLWEEGSDATHDLQANMERAIEHVDFLKLFFEVAFELPARVAASSHGAVPSDPIELS